jgi:hypothetical protein
VRRLNESSYVLDGHANLAAHVAGHVAPQPPYALDGAAPSYVIPNGPEPPYVPDSHVVGATAACDGFGWEARAAQVKFAWEPP